MAPPHLLTLLEKIAVENGIKTHDIKVSSISTGGANYSTNLYLAEVRGEGKELQLFIKVAALGEKIRKQKELRGYDVEFFFYADLLRVYRRLEQQHGLSQEHSLKAPKYYGADGTFLRETLVLENLACQGFVLNDRMKSVHWEYARSAITELAKFHALSMKYEVENPQEFEEVVKRCQYFLFTDSEPVEGFYDSLVKTSLDVVREENKEKLKAFLDRHSYDSYKSLYTSNRRCVLAHADYRPSNMLYKVKKDGTIDLRIVDYQTVSHGSAVIDLIYFIFLATDGPFRAQYYHRLVKHYHDELGRALARLGLDVEKEYPAEDYRLELQEKLPYAVLLTIFLLPLCTVEEHVAPKPGSEVGFDDIFNVPTGQLFATRINEHVDDFIALGLM